MEKDFSCPQELPSDTPNPELNSLSCMCFFFNCSKIYIGAPLVAQMVKNLPAMQETRVQSLDQEDPLEKGMATHSSILTWEIPWTEEPGGLHSMRLPRARHG